MELPAEIQAIKDKYGDKCFIYPARIYMGVIRTDSGYEIKVVPSSKFHILARYSSVASKFTEAQCQLLDDLLDIDQLKSFSAIVNQAREKFFEISRKYQRAAHDARYFFNEKAKK